MFQTLIASATVGAGGASNITFSSIPQTYTDLVVAFSGRAAGGSTFAYLEMQFNGDTSGGNYTYKNLLGTGSGPGSEGGNFGIASYFNDGASTASVFSNSQILVANYTSATAKVTSADSVMENNATATRMAIHIMRWTGTAAITQILLKDNGGNNLAQYSTAYLYGTLKGSGGATAS
jgi:hypothetical protein